MKVLNKIKQVYKAYTEGIYADTPANRKLGRVGMTYAEYSKKLKDDKEEKAEKKLYYIKFSDGEEFVLEKNPTSKERAIEIAVNYAEEMVKYNGYKEFSFTLEENTEDWSDEDIDNKKWDWYNIKAKKHGDKIEISVYDFNTNEYIRNDKQKRLDKNAKQNIKKNTEKSDKEFQERFGWLEEFLQYQQKENNIKDKDITIDKIFKNKIDNRTKNDLTNFFIKRFNYLSGGKVKEKYQIPLDKRDSLWEGAEIKNVSVENIVPSQDYLNPEIVREYLTKEDLETPLGIYIEGPDWKSSKIVLFNGHHRVAASILKGKKEIPIKIIGSYNLFKHLK